MLSSLLFLRLKLVIMIVILQFPSCVSNDFTTKDSVGDAPIKARFSNKTDSWDAYNATMEGHRGTIWNHTDNIEYLKEEDSLIDDFFITDGLQSNYPQHRNLTYSFDSSTLYDAVKDWFSNKTAALIKYGPMNSWDVSLVDNMSGLFWCYGHGLSFGSIYDNCQAFNEDISNWDVSVVTNMALMFNDARSFNQSLSGWNVARVTDMYYMFSSAYSFNQSLSSWNVARVTDMYMMFTDASSFNQSLSSWNVTSVSDMSYMFYGASSFEQKLCWNVVGKQTTDMFTGPRVDLWIVHRQQQNHPCSPRTYQNRLLPVHHRLWWVSLYP